MNYKVRKIYERRFKDNKMIGKLIKALKNYFLLLQLNPR